MTVEDSKQGNWVTAISRRYSRSSNVSILHVLTPSLIKKTERSVIFSLAMTNQQLKYLHFANGKI
jgi:phosphatidate phosphatase PAH1